jgi:hypothetical protein
VRGFGALASVSLPLSAAMSLLLAASLGCAPSPAEEASRDPHPRSIAEGMDCANCHTTDSWKISGRTSGTSGFDHDKTGFPLSGEHGKVACTDCHVDGQAVTRDCASCHKDPHNGRLGLGCDSCHSSRSFVVTDAIAIHRKTAFPLDGMHVLADCSECHRRPVEKGFVDAPRDCFACHEAEYMNANVHPNHRGTPDSPPFPRDCAVCHRTMGWVPATVDPGALGLAVSTSALSNHDARFPVSFGPHRGAECNSCHLSLESPWVLSCTGCHEHSPAAVTRRHRQPVSTDARACVGCHPGGMAP